MLESVLSIGGATMAFFGLFVLVDLSVSRRLAPERQRQIQLLAFLTLALVSLGYNTEVRPGVIVDARGAVIAAATVFGGFPLGGTVAAAAAAYRGFLGGAGAWAGVAGIAVDLLLALAVVRLLARRGITWHCSFRPIVAAGAAVAAGEAASLLAVPPRSEAFALFRDAGPTLALVQLVTTVLIGGLGKLLWERRREGLERAALAQRYALLSRYASDAIVLADGGGRILEANLRACQLYGYGDDEIRQRRLDDLRADDSPARDQEARLETASKVPDGRRQVHVRRDGTRVDVEVKERLLTDAGPPLRLVIVRDITATEKTLLRYHRALETTAEGFVIFSPDQRVLEANEALCALTGYDRTELVGMRLADLVADPGEDGSPPALALVPEGPGRRFESRWRRRDGTTVDVEVSASADPGSSEPLIAFVRDVGERRRAEQALAESERRYRLLAENSTDVIWTLEVPSLRFSYVSPSIERLRGFTPEEVLAQPMEAALTPESARKVSELLPLQIAAFEAGDASLRTAVNEISQPRKDGSVVETEVVTTLLTGESGRVTRILGVTRNVTDRKRREEELRIKEAALASSSAGIVIAGLDATITYVNRACLEMWGFASAEEVLGTSAFAYWEDPEVARRSVGAALSEGRFTGDAVARRKDRSTFDANVLMNRVADADGRPLCMLASFVDVTEAKAAEAALRANQARLEEAQALAHLGSWTFDLATERLEWSREAFGVFEVDPSAFGGGVGDFLSRVHPDDREMVEQAYRRSLASGSPQEIEHRLLAADGRVKWVRERWRTELGPDGAPLRWTGTVQDLSEQMLAREARSLAEARDAAESANRAKSAFLASMSHEIRTPMNAILGFSQLLMGDPGLNGRQKEQLGAIQRSGEHLLGLIDDVLEMSKIEAGRVTVNETEVDLFALTFDLESMFRLRAREKDLVLEFDRAPDLPRHVVTDEKKLRQILINLLGNGVKFTARGGLKVRVRTEPDAGSAPRLVVDVEDSGPGISAGELDRLFQRFEQTRTGREASSGTGLGLAISRGFARLMRGDLTVKSRVGEGSTFTLTLPVALATAPVVVDTADTRRVRGLPEGETRRKILVADDVAENREILRQMLERVGFEVRTVSDGIEALELLGSWQPHLLLMDLRMPGMDGLEAIRTIRATEAQERTPIVAVTASAFEEDRRSVEAAGGDDFVSKPFREGELLRKVGRCLGVRYVLEDEPTAPDPTPAPERPYVPALPRPLRTALRAAVVDADLDRIRALADEVDRCHPECAGTVRELAERFEYDRLLAYLGEED